jgi:hypothetical protein
MAPWDFFFLFFFFEIHEEITLGEKNKTPNKALAAEIKLGMNICGDNGFEYACLKICNTDVKNLDHQLRWFGVSTKSWGSKHRDRDEQGEWTNKPREKVDITKILT